MSEVQELERILDSKLATIITILDLKDQIQGLGLNKRLNKINEVEYSTNFTRKFNKEGHKLTADFKYSQGLDNDSSTIADYIIGQEFDISREITKNYQTQINNLFQMDYVLPLGKNSQFEAGYKGDFNQLLTDYSVGIFDKNGIIIPNVNLTNKLEYKEKINSAYFQFGSKMNTFSYLLGMRYEDSNIDINLLTTNEFNKKKYHNFFPSVFLTYQTSDKTSFSINYSRRVTRPRSRFINPFTSYSSNVNLFQGNPQINPSFTDAIDFGYMTKWNKITFTSSVYFNKTIDYFQFIKRPNGEIVTSIINGETVETPVILSTPINLSDENRFGFEPEITAKIAKTKCRIYEVGISYNGRTYEEGKKITWKDGFRALYCIIKYNLKKS